MTIWRMWIACWIPKATNIHSEYVIPIAFFATTIVTRNHFSVTLYVYCLSGLIFNLVTRILNPAL